MGEVRRREDVIMQQHNISRAAARNARRLMSIEINGMSKEQRKARRNRKYSQDSSGMFGAAMALGSYIQKRRGTYKATKERHAAQSKSNRHM